MRSISPARRTFLPTPSARRATGLYSRVRQGLHDFYPRPPRGGRLILSLSFPDVHKFLPTPSARRATPQTQPLMAKFPNFYPRPPRGGRRFFQRFVIVNY